MSQLRQELVVALRQFRQSPGLAVLLALTVGLGVGPNLAIFVLLRDAFLPSGPYQNPDRLVVVENVGPYFYEGSVPEGLPSSKLSGPDFTDLIEQQRSLSALGGFVDQTAVLTGADRPLFICRIFVTARMLDLLEVRPTRGRLFEASDFSADASGVALVTDGLWRSHFGADPSAVGRHVRLDEQPFTVVGVLPVEAFGLLQRRKGLFDEGGRDRCVITPLLSGHAGETERLLAFSRQRRDVPWLQVVGRVAPGVRVDAVQRESSAVGGRLAVQYPSTNGKRGFRIVPLDTWRTSDIRSVLLMLAAAALLALLVACASATGFVMSDSIKREPELAVRHALGATRSQLLVAGLIRSLLWSLPGGVLGCVFGYVMLMVLWWGASAARSGLAAPGFRISGLMVALLLTLVSGLATGLVGSAKRQPDLCEALRESGQLASTGRRRSRVSLALVMLQIGAAAALAVGAALLVRSVWNIVALDRGFSLGRGFVIDFGLPRSRYGTHKAHVAFYEQALSRVRALPGVTSAGISSSPPLINASASLTGDLVVETPFQTRTFNRMNAHFVTAGYLEALDVRVVRGRLFSDRDEQSRAAVVVADESFCRSYLDGADPLASVLKFGRDSLAIVGVIRDVEQSAVPGLTRPLPGTSSGTAYLLFARLRQVPRRSFLVVRAQTATPGLDDGTMRAVLAVDNSAVLSDARSFAQLLATGIAERRRILSLLGSFAAIVLLVMALSVAAALTQFATVRAREIAIRVAIGASRRQIVALIWRKVAAVVAAGLVAGTAGGLVLARALSTQLYGVDPGDARTFAIGLGVVVAIIVGASTVPVWRACRADPIGVLRAM